MLGAPPPEPDPKKKPKNPAGEGGFKVGHFLLLMAAMFGVFYFFSVMWKPQSQESSSSAVDDQTKPMSRKPVSVFDDEVSSLIIRPSPTWATAEVLLNEMAIAKSEWVKKNPYKRIVAFETIGEKPADYGYCWVLHYEGRP